VVSAYTPQKKRHYLINKELLAALKEKTRIREVILSHQNDLKDANNDMKLFVEKYHQFTQNPKDSADVRK
jgi:hypothetical protein